MATWTWAAPDWRYLLVPETDTIDRSAADYDDSSWSIGSGPFANGLADPEYTSLGWGPPQTTIPVNTGLWCRRHINRGGTASVRIDGDAWVYLDGSLIGSRVGSVAGSVMGEFTVPLPSGGLLAVFALDDPEDPARDFTYFDMYVPVGEPKTRLYPRDDGNGLSSAPRLYPPPKARRIVGGYQ